MITVQEYGKLQDGQVAFVYTIVNKFGNRLSLTNYGARVLSFIIKDKQGEYKDIVLGYDNLDGYISDKDHIGATVGINISFDKNTKSQTDTVSFDKELWDAIISGQEGEECVIFEYLHKVDDQKSIRVQMQYSLSEDNQIIIREQVVPSCDVVCNFAQQVFFNLNATNNLDGHTAIVNANSVNYTQGGWTPKGVVESVSGRANLNTPKTLKNLGAAKHSMIKKSGWS